MDVQPASAAAAEARAADEADMSSAHSFEY